MHIWNLKRDAVILLTETQMKKKETLNETYWNCERQYRCTLARFTGRNALAGQGHYLRAYSVWHALEQMKDANPTETRFTITLWK